MQTAGSDEERREAAETLVACIGAGHQPLPCYTDGSLFKIGYPVEAYMAAVRQYSIIPLELAFWVLMVLVSHYLAYKGAILRIGSKEQGGLVGGSVRPTLWTQLIGQPGSGKGITWEALREALGLPAAADDPSQIPVCGTRQSWFDALEEAEGKAVLQFIDEWPQWWAAMRADKKNAEWIGEYIRTFRYEPIGTKYLKRHYRVDKPMLSIVGLSQPEALREALKPQDYQCGFVRRWLFIWSSHHHLSMADVDRYDPSLALARIRKSGALDRLKAWFDQTPVLEEYHLDDEADAYLRHHVLSEGLSMRLGQEWVTTNLYTARKLALVYHWLHDGQDCVVKKESARYAHQLTKVVFAGLRHLLDQQDLDVLAQALDKAYLYVEQCRQAGTHPAWKGFEQNFRGRKWEEIRQLGVLRTLYDLALDDERVTAFRKSA